MAKVGGELVCYCGRCKLSLAHTILALADDQVAQVQCNTCKNIHANQRRRGERSAPASKPRRSSKAGGISVDINAYEAKLKTLAGRPPRPYAPATQFEKDDVIDHAQFGRGIVLRTEFPDKIEVMFSTAVKILIHNQK